MDLNAKAREIVYHFILYTMTLPIENGSKSTQNFMTICWR